MTGGGDICQDESELLVVCDSTAGVATICVANHPFVMMNNLTDTKLVDSLSELAQELTRRKQVTRTGLKARFPTGYIRRIDDISQRLPFLDAERRRTVACALQLCDVNKWFLQTWDVALTAGTMWEWHCTVPIVAVIETLLYEYGRQNQWITGRTDFKKVINTLQSKGVYRHALVQELHELREYRNEIHLSVKGKVELHDGMLTRYARAERVLEEVVSALCKHSGSTLSSDMSSRTKTQNCIFTLRWNLLSLCVPPAR